MSEDRAGQLELLEANSTERLSEIDSFDGIPAFIFDVPDTIAALGYGSHQFFRYYGKFPSRVGREIIEHHTGSGDHVLDCYSGSGTTLVEAQIAGSPSAGIDINPLAVLACNVKTGYFDYEELQDGFEWLTARLTKTPAINPPGAAETKLHKWFEPEAIRELAEIRAAIISMPESAARRFLTVTYLAIVRRTSRAFDGEVRPHINVNKRSRSPIEAFAAKYKDMLGGLKELDSLRSPGVRSTSVIGDNRSSNSFELSTGGSVVDLIVAHPPYLNSFNYLQVYGLEFAWAEGLPDVWGGWTLEDIKRLESRAWPATDQRIVESYYADMRATAATALTWLRPGGTFAFVIGDATIRGKLEPVVHKTKLLMQDIGYEPEKVWFRTTHYGIGKYAYRHRADYHGEATKRDGVIFFRRPERT
jgi:hypothetical protein